MSANLARTIVGSGFGLNVGFSGHPSVPSFMDGLAKQLKGMAASVPENYPPAVSETHFFGDRKSGLKLDFWDTGELKIDAQPVLPVGKKGSWGFQGAFNPVGGEDGLSNYESWLFKGSIPESPFVDGDSEDPKSPENNLIYFCIEELPADGGAKYYSAGLGFRASADWYVSSEKFNDLLNTLKAWVVTTGGLWKVDENKSSEGRELFLNFASIHNLPAQGKKQKGKNSAETGSYSGSVHLAFSPESESFPVRGGVYLADIKFETPYGDYASFMPPVLLTFIEQYAAHILAGEGESGAANR